MDMIFLHMECPFFYVDTDTVSNDNDQFSYSNFNNDSYTIYMYMYIQSHGYIFTELTSYKCLTVELLA